MKSTTKRLALATAAVVMASAVRTMAETPREIPLALVGPDTVTTTELNIELGLMQVRNENNVALSFGEPKDILKRLTQNHLIIQEGFRMGLDQEFTVRNQCDEVVRHECMKALLDSVALAIPAETPGVQDKRKAAVGAYLDGLFRRYGVSVDSTVLRSLDYGSAEAAVQKRLQNSTEVLARVGNGRSLTVADFTRELRFTEFHGLVGKPDASQRRDDILRDHLAQVAVNRQLKAQKMDQQPQMVMLRARFERSTILEEALRVLLQFDFAPTSQEISHYYRAHTLEVTAPPRLKMASLKAASPEVANQLREKILGGATVRWLAENDKRVAKGPAPFPDMWLRPEEMGLKPEDVKLNMVPEPYQVPDGWVVAQVVALEPGQPLPLEQCREQILGMMKRDAMRDHMAMIIARLEKESPIVILPGAEQEVARVVAEVAKAATANAATINNAASK